MGRVSPRGWYVEVDDPQTGHTWRPAVVGDPEILPGVTDFPRISIPVRKRDRWFDRRYEGTAMRVWKDGVRQPIDQLEDVSETERGVELQGRGGVELQRRVQLEVDSKEAHQVVEDLIQNNTSYTANVDTPDADVRTNEQVQSADSTTELQNLLQPIASTEPLTITNGTLKTQQSAFHAEGEQFALSSTNSDSAASEGQFEKMASNLSDSVTRTVPYTIPASRVGVAVRYRNPTDPDSDSDFEGYEFEIRVDGERALSFAANFATGSGDFRWTTDDSAISSDVSGDTTITIDGGSSGNETDIDLVVLYDSKYSYTFDNSVDSNSRLSGPETKPDRVEIETTDSLSAFQFAGGRLETSYSDTSNKQRVGVSNDRGQSFTYANNSETVETDFVSGGARLRGKLSLSRYGSNNGETPTTGYKSQTVDLYRLKGDIDETPLLVNQDYDARLIDIIQDIADYGDFIGEFRKRGGTPSFEFAKVGQRTASETPTPTSYEYQKRTEPVIDKVVIKSGRQQVREESITANHGTAVNLDNGNINRGTESVYDPSTGTEYVAGEDYELSPGVETSVGSITTLAAGDITDGQSLAVNYAHHLEGVSTVTNPPSNPKTLIETFPSLTSQRAVDQAAVLLRRQIDSPFDEVTVTLPTSEVGFNVVEAQEFAALPSDENFEIREITTSAKETVFRLGSRESIGEAVERIRSRLSAAAQRV